MILIIGKTIIATRKIMVTLIKLITATVTISRRNSLEWKERLTRTSNRSSKYNVGTPYGKVEINQNWIDGRFWHLFWYTMLTKVMNTP